MPLILTSAIAGSSIPGAGGHEGLCSNLKFKHPPIVAQDFMPKAEMSEHKGLQEGAQVPVNNGSADETERPAPQYTRDSAAENGEFGSSSYSYLDTRWR